MRIVSRYYHIISKQPRPIRFLISRILWRTGLCKLFIINRSLYKLRFFPTVLSAAYWINPNERDGDERFFINYLKKGDVVIDVGANIGALSLLAANMVGNDGEVISIEAHPKTFFFLKENVKLNEQRNIVLHNVAVGDRNGILYFSDYNSDDQNHVINGHGIKVQVRKLDDLIPSVYQKIDLLKVDVEGYEKFVFWGAQKVLEKCKCIYFEAWEQHFEKYGYTTFEILCLLRNNGFELFRCIGNELTKINDLSFSTHVCENLLAIRDVSDFLARTGWILTN